MLAPMAPYLKIRARKEIDAAPLRAKRCKQQLQAP
jgi:hypothetical protein